MRTFDLFIAQQASENTKLAYQNDMAKWKLFLDGRTPTEELALAWRDHLEATVAMSSAVRAFSTVRSYYRWADLPNPFEKIKAPRRVSNWTPVAPDENDVDKLIAVCTNPRDAAILGLLNNGLRASEVVDLKVDDLTYEHTYQTWVLRVTGKGQKMRFVPLNSETETVLNAYHGAKGGKMFPGLTRRKVYYIFQKWGKLAKVNLHPHALRHGFATRLIRNDVSVLHVQKLMGHQRTETTSLYVNLELSDLVAATKRDPRNQTVPHKLRIVS